MIFRLKCTVFRLPLAGVMPVPPRFSFVPDGMCRDRGGRARNPSGIAPVSLQSDVFFRDGTSDFGAGDVFSCNGTSSCAHNDVRTENGTSLLVQSWSNPSDILSNLAKNDVFSKHGTSPCVKNDVPTTNRTSLFIKMACRREATRPNGEDSLKLTVRRIYIFVTSPGEIRKRGSAVRRFSSLAAQTCR